MVRGSLLNGITPKEKMAVPKNVPKNGCANVPKNGCARQEPGAQGVCLVKEGPCAKLYAVFGNFNLNN
jgi:hypothetical protein